MALALVRLACFTGAPLDIGMLVRGLRGKAVYTRPRLPTGKGKIAAGTKSDETISAMDIFPRLAT